MTKIFNDLGGASESSTTTKLIEALVEAQKNYPTIDLDAKNDHLRSKYATYRGCCEALRGPLTDNGLTLPSFQSAHVVGLGWVLLGVLRHVSGEYITGCVPLLNNEKPRMNPNTKEIVVDPPTMQGLGAAMTYAKRQLLLALTGAWVGEVDDDGESVAHRPQPQRQQSRPFSTQDSESSDASSGSMKEIAFEAKALNAITTAQDRASAQRALATVELRLRERVISKSVLDRCTLAFKKKWGEA
jgi:hypothetical protein